MIRVGDKYEMGMKEAAEHLDVSERTLRRYVNEKIVEMPPVVRQGTRTLKYFPKAVLRRMQQQIANYGEGKGNRNG